MEKVLPLEAGKRYPVCLTGKRACPPEDGGGIWGYASFLEAIQPRFKGLWQRMGNFSVTAAVAKA